MNLRERTVLVQRRIQLRQRACVSDEMDTVHPVLVLDEVIRVARRVVLRISDGIAIFSEGNAVEDLVELLAVLPPQQSKGFRVVCILGHDQRETLLFAAFSMRLLRIHEWNLKNDCLE